MAEENEIKEETKTFFKTVKTTVKNWFAKSFKWIAIAFASLFGLILFKKIDSVVTVNDQKKKDEAKQNLKDLKENNNGIKEASKDAENIVNDMSNKLETDKEEEKIAEQTYIEKQTNLAEKAGFVKR